jgi:hypothetical protein
VPVFILHSFSRNGQFIKDFPDDRFDGFFPGLGFASNGYAVSAIICVRVSPHRQRLVVPFILFEKMVYHATTKRLMDERSKGGQVA